MKPHVRAWLKAGKQGYQTPYSDELLDKWFEHMWSTDYGDFTVKGPLRGVQDSYSERPIFTIYVEDPYRPGSHLFIGAEFEKFDMLPLPKRRKRNKHD